jgi:FtsP/CotA-like multicopper oxidase with cupredoxin domain
MIGQIRVPPGEGRGRRHAGRGRAPQDPWWVHAARVRQTRRRTQRRDNEATIIYRGFRDFVGPYLAHCRNLAHEDHAMMFGWTIVP